MSSSRGPFLWSLPGSRLHPRRAWENNCGCRLGLQEVTYMKLTEVGRASNHNPDLQADLCLLWTVT